MSDDLVRRLRAHTTWEFPNDVVLDPLTAEAADRIEQLERQNEEIRHVRPSIDYSKLPAALAGKWVVIRRSTQQPMGAGDTPEEAFEEAGISLGSPEMHEVVVTRVPVIDVANGDLDE